MFPIPAAGGQTLYFAKSAAFPRRRSKAEAGGTASHRGAEGGVSSFQAPSIGIEFNLLRQASYSVNGIHRC